MTSAVNRVPPAAALQQQVAAARSLLPMAQRLVVGPILDTFSAYIAATDAELHELRKQVTLHTSALSQLMGPKS